MDPDLLVDRIYLDHNATTPVLPEAREAMLEALTDGWGNPSSGHWAGRRAHALRERARAQIGALVDAAPERVVVVSGATEAIHLAVRSALAVDPARRAVVATNVEHPALPGAVESHGGTLVDVSVAAGGALEAAAMLAAVDAAARGGRGRGAAAALTAVMAANNETGVEQPVAELAPALRDRGVPLLVDATQLAGKRALPLDAANVPYLVLAGHKLGGPKGVGALVLGDGASLDAQFRGGGQEGGRRGGTEPMPALVGFGAACAHVLATRDAESARLEALRDRLQGALLAALPGSSVVGLGQARLPNTLSFTAPEGVTAPDLVAALDREGVAVSAGAACHAGENRPSRVLLASGVPAEAAVRTLRISLGATTTEADVARVSELLPMLVDRLTSASP